MIPFGGFMRRVSILKLHNAALHNTAPLRLTSPHNVPSVETEEGFTQSGPVAVVLLKASALWLVFPRTGRHFHPVSFSRAWRDERAVRWVPACQSEFNYREMWVCPIMCCILVFNISSGRFKERPRVEGGVGEVIWKGMARQSLTESGVQRKVLRSVVKRKPADERRGGDRRSRDQETWCERGGEDRKRWIFHQKRNPFQLF